MKAAYAAHAVTLQDAWHLAAFFKESASATPSHEKTGIVHGTAAGAAFVVLAAVFVVFRPRRRR